MLRLRLRERYESLRYDTKKNVLTSIIKPIAAVV